jgi:hypothetical protein
MSATTVLRANRITTQHAQLKKRLLASAAKFKVERGYTPPYWELVRLAREMQMR